MAFTSEKMYDFGTFGESPAVTTTQKTEAKHAHLRSGMYKTYAKGLTECEVIKYLKLFGTIRFRNHELGTRSDEILWHNQMQYQSSIGCARSRNDPQEFTPVRWVQGIFHKHCVPSVRFKCNGVFILSHSCLPHSNFPAVFLSNFDPIEASVICADAVE